ncbi:hypothetical protein METBIDRAFT_42360 [Metschnikowia bicuspidata var. bicuspidata NRRL YB-4993]|uniref:Uncharacterized protein n=1 Tax=Metschnikowia bicuspidata var. bicuspidata NRRL YB-4993 TaxID=869754 RepID=A0A1A0HBU6_9ASCO|nr:hypothetical protein METBIDRAFT_42360 [Metschnikowia bicuspidata var. bicuspidata NRRL YB-4993]OBA21455.1 hypothetical protein METBIDRAFT_42360 [Metschnikowia bicuspidata var. bicuspidata NRRL YB-4993]
MRVLYVLTWAMAALAYQQFCKCQCNEQLLVERIDQCKQCTKEWCLLQDAQLCLPEETSDSMIISCFQNESKKEQAIVYAFIIAIVVLLGKLVLPFGRRT